MILKNHIVMVKDGSNKLKTKNTQIDNLNNVKNNEAQNCANGEIKELIENEEEIVNFLNDDNSQNAFFSISMSIQQENMPALFNKFNKPGIHNNNIFTNEIEEIIDDNSLYNKDVNVDEEINNKKKSAT